MQDICLDMDCTQLRAKVVSGELTSVALVTAVLDAIEANDSRINAYITVFKSQALARAGEIDTRIAQGEPVGQLAGVPVAIKDNLCFTQGATTCASQILASFHAPYDATVVEKLLAEDAVILGKLNMD